MISISTGEIIFSNITQSIKAGMEKSAFDQRDKLCMVQMSLSTGVIKSWDNWSEDNEKKLKTAHDKLLKENLGLPPYKYSLGNITSNYDPRFGSSMLTIEYYK